jgi:hypothetical protein
MEIVIKFSWVISHVNSEQKPSVSGTFSAFLIKPPGTSFPDDQGRECL